MRTTVLCVVPKYYAACELCIVNAEPDHEVYKPVLPNYALSSRLPFGGDTRRRALQT